MSIQVQGQEAKDHALAAALAGIGDTDTTSVARHMVGQASAGCFPEALDGFVALLGDCDTGTDQVQAAVGRLDAIGAHPGADMLAGAVALAVRAGRERRTRWGGLLVVAESGFFVPLETYGLTKSPSGTIAADWRR